MDKWIKFLRAFFFTAAFCVLSFAADKTKIAVMDFESIGSEIRNTELGLAIAENLRTALIDSQKFSVIERSSLQKIFDEQKLQYSGAIDQNTAVKIGKVAGAEKIVTGSVTKLGDMYTINVRFIDVMTAFATDAKKVTGLSENELPRMIDDIVALLTGEAVRVSGGEPSRQSTPAAKPRPERVSPEASFPRNVFQFGLGSWTPDLIKVKAAFEVDSLSMVMVPFVYRYDKKPELSFKLEIAPSVGSEKKECFGGTDRCRLSPCRSFFRRSETGRERNQIFLLKAAWVLSPAV